MTFFEQYEAQLRDVFAKFNIPYTTFRDAGRNPPATVNKEEKCTWCFALLVFWVETAMRCPTCGAIDFKEDRRKS